MAAQSNVQHLAAQMRNSQYEATIREFAQNKGRFIAMTDDQAFLSVLKTVLYKHVAISSQDVLMAMSEPAHTLKAIKEADAAGEMPFLLMERKMNGQDSSFMVKQLKAAFPRLLILILTVDVERHRIMYLHEVGADNVIAKPVSAQTIIEKLAFTIKPQGQLGQMIDRAKMLLLEGKPDKAKILAKAILQVKPESAAGLMVLGDAEMARGDMDAARQAYLEASSNADLYLEPLRKLAALAEKTGNIEESLNYLEQLDKLSPLNADRKVSMGELNLSLGNEGKAQKLFDTAVDQVTKEAMGQIGSLAERIAGIYADKNPEQSEKFLRKALAVKQKNLTREDIRVFNQLGITLRQQGKWKEAIKEYTRALTIAPDDGNLLYNLALAYAQGEMPREARLSMEKAYAANKHIPYTAAGVAYNMGLVLLKGGAKDKARECFSIALEQDPGMTKAQKALDRL